jgi:signal transduction histidine kinase
VIISIADEGIGMNVQQVARVFDKFYRVDVSDTAARGLGLGMNIVKQIVDQHGGSITVASKPGHGTNVTIFLPDHYKRPG